MEDRVIDNVNAETKVDGNETLVEFRTVLNRDKTKALLTQSIVKLWWLFLLVSAVFAMLGVLGIIYPEDMSDVYFGIAMIVVGVLFTPLVIVISLIIQKRLDKSTTFISDDTFEVYLFDDEKITVTQTRGDEFSVTTKAKYSYFYKVEQTSTHYFLYISKMQCHIIDKASISKGTVEMFDSLLVSKLGNRFKQR